MTNYSASKYDPSTENDTDDDLYYCNYLYPSPAYCTAMKLPTWFEGYTGTNDDRELFRQRLEMMDREPAFCTSGASDRMLLPHGVVLAEELERVSGSSRTVTTETVLAFQDAASDRVKAFLRGEIVKRWLLAKTALIISRELIGLRAFSRAHGTESNAWCNWTSEKFLRRFPFPALFVAENRDPKEGEPAPGGWIVAIDWFRGDWLMNVTYMTPEPDYIAGARSFMLWLRPGEPLDFAFSRCLASVDERWRMLELHGKPEPGLPPEAYGARFRADVERFEEEVMPDLIDFLSGYYGSVLLETPENFKRRDKWFPVRPAVSDCEEMRSLFRNPLVTTFVMGGDRYLINK